MKTPTLQEFKVWSKKNRTLALEVCAAQAKAEVTRERVDAYVQPILERFAFKKDLDILKDVPDFGEPITTVRDLYQTEDPRLPEFYAACQQAHKDHGYQLPDGYCPALVAENEYIKKQNALLEAGSDLLGVDLQAVYELRGKAIDLLLGACLKEQES